MNIQHALLAGFIALASTVNPAETAPVTAPPAALYQPLTESFEKAASKLELDPDNSDLLESCGLAALAEGEKDLGLWYLMLAADAAPTDKKLAARVEAVMTESQHPFASGSKLLEEYAETLFNISNACTAKQFYANSVEILSRCSGTRFEEQAQQRMDKIFKKKKAVESLLSSGISVPVNPKRKKSAKKVAALNEKHGEWKDPHVAKGNNYTIRTNMGYNMAQDMLSAMEQINKFYRQSFNHEVKGKKMKMCTINVFKSRSEFDKNTGVESSVLGFFSPSSNDVTTYDHRADPNREGTMAELWSTLFHEASHQFTHAVWDNPIPTWLNEGTASYFEGTRIDPGGKVVFNLVPDSRLRSLVFLMKAEAVRVREVISHFQGGSYSGEFYPYGWGLVYFMRNYEDENCNRVYLPILREFMDSYNDEKANNSIKGRFIEYFVEKAAQEDATTFKEFVAKWEAWILELNRVHVGGEEVVDELIERGDRQLKFKFPVAAMETYNKALRKSPTNAYLLEATAKLFVSMKKGDAALYRYRQLADEARKLAESDPEVSEELLAVSAKGIRKVNARVAELLAGVDTKFIEGSLKLAEQCREADLPRSALHYLKQAGEAVRGDIQLSRAFTDLSEELDGEVDLFRARRVPTDSGLANWDSGEAWSGGKQGLVVDKVGMSIAFLREELPARYRFEARIELPEDSKGTPAYGLTFGPKDGSAMRLYTIAPSVDRAMVVEFGKGPSSRGTDFEDSVDYRGLEGTIAIDVRPGHVDFYYEDELVAEMDVDEPLLGQVGLMVQGTEATWTEVRLKY